MTTKAQSVHAGAMLLQKLSSDTRLAGKIQAARNYSDFLEVARKEGFDLSGLSEQEAIELAKGDRAALGEISEAELGQVAGGSFANQAFNFNNPPPPSPSPGGWPTWSTIGW